MSRYKKNVFVDIEYYDIHQGTIRKETVALPKDARVGNITTREVPIETHVRVQFIGHSKSYCYEVRPGPEVKVGDYLMVWSPLTGRDELVKVVELGRGDWRGPSKIARRIEVEETRERSDLVDDLFGHLGG